MTAISDQCNVIRGWLAIGDDVYPDQVVTSWIRMAEESLSKVLRCKDMIQIDHGILIEQRYLLPKDWREMSFVRRIGGAPLRYFPKDDFYNPDSSYVSDQKHGYTLSGNYIIVGGTNTDGIDVEIHYYQDIPPLGDDPTWLSIQYPTLFTISTLNIAAMYAIEDSRLEVWGTAVATLIKGINEEHQLSKASGSRLTRRHLGKIKGFG